MAEIQDSMHAPGLVHINSELDQFIRIVTHDLRSPLAIIIGYLELMREDLQNGHELTDMESMKAMISQARWMDRMIIELHQFTKLTRFDPNPSPVDLTDVLLQAVEKLKHPIKKYSADIQWGDLPVLAVSESQMVLVFQHLIDNAIKFRSDRPLRIHIRGRQLTDCWRFSVGDNGIGISARAAKNIFNIFSGGKASATSESIGLGLAICKKIIEQHQGRIWVESQENNGATFFFTLSIV